MKDNNRFGLPTLSRRKLIEASLLTTGASAWMSPSMAAQQKAIDQMTQEGWSAQPLACVACGGYCGLLGLKKKGARPSKESIRIVANPTHPQRGLCARSASSMWIWDSPARLKRPLMRVGERGEGKFKEVSWDEALDAIAERLKKIVNQYGEKSVALTSHNFTALDKWFGYALGTPNVVGHSSSCNTGSIMGRRLVFGKGFDGAGKVEPDYIRARMLLLIGRTLNCSMGVSHTVSEARQRGCKVVFVDPRMPEGAFADSTWYGIKPGTDAALVLSMINVGITEKLIDEDFLVKHTNAPYLLTEEGRPLTQADFKDNGDKALYALMDKTTGKIVFQGVKRDQKGKVLGFIENASTEGDIHFDQTIDLKNGVKIRARTAFEFLKETSQAYTPQYAQQITGIPAQSILALARDFFELKGVVDDGWYSSKNGNDEVTYALINVLNVLTGQFDQKGGCVITAGGGFKAPGVSAKGTKAKGPQGQTWELSDGKRLDLIKHPDASGTISALFDAMTQGVPYPVKALFVTGSTMFHREANSERLANALKSLDLFVYQDILPHEVMDYADFVLPSTYFVEHFMIGSVKWALDGYVHTSRLQLDPPGKVDARHDLWQLCEILRRAYPERAAERLGYSKEIRLAREFDLWYNGMTKLAFEKFVAKKNALQAGEGDRIRRELDQQGWSKTTTKKFGVYPYKKPFGTPTGKAEIVSFYALEKYNKSVLNGILCYQPSPAYREPIGKSNEFYLVSGKDAIGSSGTSLFMLPSKYLCDRAVWMNTQDAQRLHIEDGQMIEIEGIDTGVKGQTKVKVTNRVIAGTLFAYGFQGGVRTKNLPKEFEWVREGINSHWFATGYATKASGSVANNSSVRIKKL